ncbi:hypothetical protein PYCC9005_004438 [Savitreella phatthalungensis]
MVSSSYTGGNFSSPNASLPLNYFPAIRPAALLVGTIYEHVTSALVYGPLFGQTWEKVMNSDKNSEFWKTKEAQSAASIYGASLISSGVQTYAISALLQLTGTVSYKGAAYLGLIVFGATSVPGIISSTFSEKRPLEYTAIKSVTALLQTVGLGVVLTAFGHRRDVIS